MKRLIMHFVWHPHRTERVSFLWNDILPHCAALSPQVEPHLNSEVFLDLTGAHCIETIIQEFLLLLDSLQQEGDRKPPVFTLAPNKFVARTASMLILQRELPSTVHLHQTPKALYTKLRPSQVEPFLAPLSVDSLWPIEQRVRERLVALGIKELADLRRVPQRRLSHEFGTDVGRKLLALAYGNDPTPVQPLYPPRTIEVCWSQDAEHEQCELNTLIFTRVLRSLAEELTDKLNLLGLACSKLLLRLHFPKHTMQGECSLPYPTSTFKELGSYTERLFTKAALTSSPYRIQLIAGELTLPRNLQATLFSGAKDSATALRAEKIVASVRKRFGTHAIQYASVLYNSRREQMRAIWQGTTR